MKRTRQVVPPSQNPQILWTLPEGEVISTCSSTLGDAVAIALYACSQRPQSRTVSAPFMTAGTENNIINAKPFISFPRVIRPTWMLIAITLPDDHGFFEHPTQIVGTGRAR